MILFSKSFGLTPPSGCRSRVGKAGSTGSAEPNFFSDSLTNFYQILPNSIINFLQNFTKSYRMLTKFVIYAVFLQFKIVVIYAFFPAKSVFQKKWVNKKYFFQLCAGGLPSQHLCWLIWNVCVSIYQRLGTSIDF